MRTVRMRVKLLIAMCVFALCRAIDLDEPKKTNAAVDSHISDSAKALNNSISHARTKRGWVSILVYGTSMITRATNLGLTLASSITGGCSAYRSICTDKDAITRLDREIQNKKAQYDKEFLHVKTDFHKLRMASTNNAYIKFYVNETVREVQELADLQEDAYRVLQIQMPKLFKMYQASQNYTSAQFLGTVIGQFETSLSDIKNMINKQSQNQLIGLAIGIMVETVAKAFTRSYSNARNAVINLQKEDIFGQSIWTAMFTADAKDGAIILDPNHAQYDEVMKKYGLKPEPASGVKRELKLVPKVLKRMGQNIKGFFSKKMVSINKWKRIKSWKGFKGKFKHSMRKPIAKLNRIKSFFSSRANRKLAIKNFKLGWTMKIMSGLGTIFDAIQIGIMYKQWHTVSVEIRKARESYEEYLSKLNKELQSIISQKPEMEKFWNDAAETFKNLSDSFKDIIKNAKENSDFNDVFGLTGLPVDITSPIFKIDFSKINKRNILDSQNSVIAFLRDINHNLKEINDQFKARIILYENIAKNTKSSKSIEYMREALKQIYNYNPSVAVQNYGSKLSKKDFVCAVAKIRIDLEEYEFYPLNAFRPKCDVSDTQFLKLEAIAQKEQNNAILRNIIKREMHNNETLSDMFVSIQRDLKDMKDPSAKAFGKSLTEQQVVCVIAETNPSRQTYDFLPLSPFRPDCSSISSSEYSRMKMNSVKKKKMVKDIENILKFCDIYKFCPCPDVVALQNNCTEEDVVLIIKQLQPERTEYCGKSI